MNRLTPLAWRRPLVFGATALLVTFGLGASVTKFVRDDLGHQSRLMNVSCRGPSGTGPESLLAAFVITDRPQTVVVRAHGWSAPKPGVPETHHDLTLRVVRNADGTDVGRNERWRAQGNERLTADLKHFAPTDERHSATVLTLPPGAYSALVEDRSGQPGMAFIEIFVVQQ